MNSNILSICATYPIFIGCNPHIFLFIPLIKENCEIYESMFETRGFHFHYRSFWWWLFFALIRNYVMVTLSYLSLTITYPRPFSHLSPYTLACSLSQKQFLDLVWSLNTLGSLDLKLPNVVNFENRILLCLFVGCFTQPQILWLKPQFVFRNKIIVSSNKNTY